ncbi:hypothetical protein [Paracoccus aerodenitrificans]|uniref:hypothetical protein n=1 Tax=Paracoccus aerodenitrificans TaxID=3017781 RepID=UPI0022F0B510|nr:hypothetical protein [Paracoccus aerodenitrificans]WBU65158.1 hypothetical protein PAE61_06955 [Paracoccus aerodenitrificans]
MKLNKGAALFAALTMLSGCVSSGTEQSEYNRMSCRELAYHEGRLDGELGAARTKSLTGGLTAALGDDEVQSYGQTQAIFGGIEENRAIETNDKVQIAKALKGC